MSKFELDIFNNKTEELSAEEIIEQLPNIPTKNLVKGFAKINEYRKNIKKIRDKTREELIGTKDNSYNGRLKKSLKSGEKFIKTNEKDNIIVEMEGNKLIELRNNSKTVIDKKATEKILKEKEIYREGVKTKVKTTSEKKMYKKLANIGNKAKANGDKETFNEIKDILESHFETKYTIDKEKVDKLVAEDKFNEEELENIYQLKEKYSIHT